MKKTLIAYFSYTNNTREIAKMIKENIDADLIEITPEVAYSSDYDVVEKQGKKETDNLYEPKIKEIGVNIKDYEQIILGTPVWWYTFAPAIRTFLSSSDFLGKEIIPFATNGGWLGSTIQDIEKLAKGAIIRNPLDIRFSGTNLRTPKEDISKWIKNI